MAVRGRKSRNGHRDAGLDRQIIARSAATNRRPRWNVCTFSCPNTGEAIDVGIESELDTLLRIRNKRVLARCPHCGERHEWRVADAQLQQAA